MVKEKLLQAKSLIEQEHYAEARKLLKSIDHPTAKQWLLKLETLAPEQNKPEKRPNKPQNGGSSTAVFLLTIGVLLLAIGGLVFFYLQRNGLPVAASVAQVQSQPTAQAGSYPCEPQRWWDENAATVYAVFQYPLFGHENMWTNQLNGSINDMRNRRVTFAASPYPTCLSELRDTLLTGMDQWVGVWEMPQFIIVDWEEIAEYEATDLYQFGTGVSNAMDTLVQVMEMLDEEGIVYDATTTGFDAGEYLSRYRKGNTPECPAIRWMMTDFYASLLLMGKAGMMISATDEDIPTSKEVRGMIGDLQRERERLDSVEYPRCVSVQHELVVDTNRLALKVFQTYFSEGVAYNTALQANDYLAKYYMLFNTVKQIDTLDIMPDSLANL